MHRAYSLDWSPDALSPTTRKNILEKNVKKITQLKEELQNEITEKNDVLEENTSLKNVVENLNKKLKSKTQENEKLKDDFHDLQLSYEKVSEKRSSRCLSEHDTVLSNLQSDLVECKKYIAELEKENESTKRISANCEQQRSKIIYGYGLLEKQHEELKCSFASNLEKLEELQKKNYLLRIELSDLKECNQVLKEENIKLEAKKSTSNLNFECLERELQFQSMKDEIEEMTNNLKTIEKEQMKLVSVNFDLTTEKAELLDKQKLIVKECEEKKSLNEKLLERIECLEVENKSSKNLFNDLDVRLKDTKKLLDDRDQQLGLLAGEFDALKTKFLGEKNELLKKHDELMKNNNQLMLRLEAIISEKETYRIALEANKTKLEAIEFEYKVLTDKNSNLSMDRDRLEGLLQKVELDLASLHSVKTKVEDELLQKSNLVTDLQASQIHLTKHCEKLSSENENLAQSLMNVNNELMTMRELKADLIFQSEETKKKNNEITQENVVLMNCNKDLTEEISVHVKLLNELKIQLESTIHELKNISFERNSLVCKYDELKRSNLELIETIRSENQDIKSINAELHELNEKNSSTIQNLRVQIQDLSSSNISLSKELQDTEEKCVNLMKDFHEKLDVASQKYEKLQIKNDTLLKENTHLQSRLSETLKERESLQQSTEDLRKKANDLLAARNCLAEELERRRLEIDKLIEQIKSLRLNLESLCMENELLQKDNGVFQNKISSLVEQERISHKKLENLAEENKTLSDNGSRRSILIDELKKQNQNLTSLNEKLSVQLQYAEDCHKEQLTTLQNELDTVVNERHLLFSDNNHLKSENSDLQNRISDFSGRNELLEQQLLQSENDRKMLAENNEELLKTIEQFKKQIDDFRISNLSISKELKDNNIMFREKLSSLQTNLSRVVGECEEKSQNISRLTNENLNLSNRNTEIMQENESLREQLEQIKVERSFLAEENAKHLQKINTLEKDISDEAKRKDNSFEQLRVSEKNAKELADSLQQELNAVLHNYELQSENRFQLAQENTTLQIQVSEILTEEQSLRQQLEKLEREKSDAVNRNNLYENDIQQLTNRIKGLVNSEKLLSGSVRIAEMSYAEKILAVNQELDSLLCEKELITKNNSDLLKKNTELQSNIAELKNQCQLLKVQLEKLEEEKVTVLSNDAENLLVIAELQQKIHDLQSSKDLLSEQLRIGEMNYANTVSDSERLLKLASEERDHFAKSCSQLAEKNTELQNGVTAMEKENDKAQEQFTKVQEEQMNSLNDLREMFLHQIDQLQKANDEIKEENRVLVEKNAEKLFCLKEVEKRFELLTQDMKDLKSKCEELEIINEKLKYKVEECKESEKNLRNENASLKVLMTNAENKKESLSGQIEVLKSRETSQYNSFQDLKKELEERKLDQKELKKVIAIESETNANLEKANSELLKKINHIESEKDKLQYEINELSRSKEFIKEREAEFQKLQQENTKFKARLEELITQKEELYKMERINKDVFENQLHSMTTKNQCLQNDVDKLHDFIENMEADMAALKEKFQRINEEQNSLVAIELEREKEQNLRISSHLEELIEANKTITEQLELEKQRGEQLVQIYKTQLLEEDKLKKSLECQLQNIEGHEIQALKNRIEELKFKLEEVVEENECLTAESKSKIHQQELLTEEIETLMYKIDQLEKQKFNIEKECNLLLEEKEENRKSNEDMRMQLKNMNELLEIKENDIIRLKDEYDVFKEEYRKLVQHKGELDKEFKDTLLQENAKLSKKCEELNSANMEVMSELAEKMKLIESLRTEINEAKERNSTSPAKQDLNETQVMASGVENEIYMNLRHENMKLAEEKDNYKTKLSEMVQLLEKEKESYRNKAQNLYNKISTKMISEYEGKLERAKAEYQKIMKQKYNMQEGEWKKREEEYKLMLKKEKEHIRYLSTQMWDISDKYLQLKQKLETKTSPIKFRTYSEETLFSPSTLSRRTKSTSQLNLFGSKGCRLSDFDRRLSAMSEDLPPPIRRRQTLTISGKKFSLSSAKVFPTEDEEQELFDNACLADLKQGRISIDDSNDFSKQRLSILQQRNSLCPPHLKSSYPAETQFIPPQEFRENEIKMGIVCENDTSDIENLIPKESFRKNRNQTSYKKPGPPTPSKNGGRSVQSEHHETPKNILKEANDNGNTRRKSYTPKFFNNLFALRGHATVTIPQDENVSTTPRPNRLSSIRRRFTKNPQEFGNTNSGFC